MIERLASATPANMTITLVCDSGVALLFYNLLKPVYDLPLVPR
jgi:hypothetical protein